MLDSMVKTGAVRDTAGARHVHALDGLRGVAAFLVMIGHSAYVYFDTGGAHGVGRTIAQTVYRSGHPSVLLFFVLSGFVLSSAYAGSAWRDFPKYMIRRLFRLYPALIAVIGLAFIVHAWQNPVSADRVGPWLASCWIFPNSAEFLLKPLLLVGNTYQDTALDPVIWSLAIELRFSILLIPLLYLGRRSPYVLLVASLALGLAGELACRAMGIVAPRQLGGTALGNLAITLFYLPTFAFGMFLAAKTGRAAPAWVNGKPILQILIALAALAAGKLANNDIAWGAVAAVLVFLSLATGPIRSLLEHGVVQFLGRISYSLYLIHPPILLALAYAGGNGRGAVIAAMVAPVISVFAAWLMSRAVEQPGIDLGRRVAARLSRLQFGARAVGAES